MEYYALNQNNEQRGPFTLQQLREKGIQPTTSVWCEGMQDWAEAGTIDDLKSLFVKPPTPPRPIPSALSQPIPQGEGETSDKILAIIICWTFISSLIWALTRLDMEVYRTDWFPIVNALTNLIWGLVPIALAAIIKSKSLQVAMYVIAGIQMLYAVYNASEALGM